MIATLLGKKIGMTQIYDAQNVLIPVTVVEAGPCPVVQVKTVESDGYNAVQLGFARKKPGNASKAELNHAKKAGLAERPADVGRGPPRGAARGQPGGRRHRRGLQGRPVRRCHRGVEGQELSGRGQETPRAGRSGGPRFDVSPPHRLDRHAPDTRKRLEEPVDARPSRHGSLHHPEPAGREGAAGKESHPGEEAPSPAQTATAWLSAPPSKASARPRNNELEIPQP